VVSNALRLRGFQRPATTHEIEQPPLARRITSSAHLTGIATLALVLGIAFTIASRSGPAQHGKHSDADNSGCSS
jgi:P-type Cu+ transporter